MNNVVFIHSKIISDYFTQKKLEDLIIQKWREFQEAKLVIFWTFCDGVENPKWPNMADLRSEF